MSDASLPVKVIDESLPDWHVPEDAAIIITHMHYRWEELSTLRKIQQRNQVPILILSDGILEYRNTWEHPELVDGSIFQPLFGHKLACIGRGQASVIESWGNVGRCEIVGLPRLDSIDREAVSPVQSSDSFRLLVATANTPAFNDQQRDTVVDSLRHIQNWIKNNPTIQDRPIEISWRLSDGLDEALDVADGIDPEDRPPIGDVIENVDAVITTPSTMYLESVLRKRPTALLDFHNSPQYITPAWNIGAPGHLGKVISELADPPHHKIMFQENVLADQLACATPAKPRLLKLIDMMVEIGNQCRSENKAMEFPHRIIEDSKLGFNAVSREFDPSRLYPDNEVFSNDDLVRLQVELNAAIKRLGQLPAELAEKNRYIAKLMKSLDRSRVRVEDMHNRVIAIRKRFGVSPIPEDDNE